MAVPRTIPTGRVPRGSPTNLYHARQRRRAAQNRDAFDADVASPFNMGTVAATNPLPTPYVVPAGARLAVSFSVILTAGQLTIDHDGRVLGTPALAADEVHRLEHAERNSSIVPTCAIAGTATLYVLDEWSRPVAIATGVFT